MPSVFSDDIAIDLGTANTLVHVAGRGVIIDEPSVVAIRNRHAVREVLDVGQKAKQVLGRTPESIETILPPFEARAPVDLALTLSGAVRSPANAKAEFQWSE